MKMKMKEKYGTQPTNAGQRRTTFIAALNSKEKMLSGSSRSNFTFAPLDEDPVLDDMEELGQRERERQNQERVLMRKRLETVKNKKLTRDEVRELTSHAYATQLAMMEENRVCTRCGASYKERNNYLWTCRTHLPGSITERRCTTSGLYSCCRASMQVKDTKDYDPVLISGCRRADHISAEEDELEEGKRNLVLPCVLVDLGFVPVHNNSIVGAHVDDDILKSYYILRRTSPTFILDEQ